MGLIQFDDSIMKCMQFEIFLYLWKEWFLYVVISWWFLLYLPFLLMYLIIIFRAKKRLACDIDNILMVDYLVCSSW